MSLLLHCCCGPCAMYPVNLLKEAGREMAKEARRLAREGQLGNAADKMEEAFNQCPSLRSKYADQVRLWRLGIAM